MRQAASFPGHRLRLVNSTFIITESTFAYIIWETPDGLCVTTAEGSQFSKIDRADRESTCSFNGRMQTKNGAAVLPPRERFLAKTSSRLFLRICEIVLGLFQCFMQTHNKLPAVLDYVADLCASIVCVV